MTTATLEHLHRDILDIKKELVVIRTILAEDFELTEEAKLDLKEAKKTPKSEYLSHEEIKRRLLK